MHGHDEAAVELAGEHADVAGEEGLGELSRELVVGAGDPGVGVLQYEQGLRVAGAEELDESLESLDYLPGADLLIELAPGLAEFARQFATDHARV